MDERAQRHADRAELLMDQNRFKKALTEWLKALQFAPDDDLIQLNMALCLFGSGQLNEADALITAHPWAELANEPALFNLRANVALSRGKSRQARKLAKEAVRLSAGQEPGLFAILVRIEINQERYREAWDALIRGLALDPVHADLLELQLTLLPLVKPRSQGWREAIERTLQTDPGSAGFHAAAGWLCWHKRDYTEAGTYFRNALQLDPANDWARLGLAEIVKAEWPVYHVFESIARPLRYIFAGSASLSVIGGTQFGRHAHRNADIRNGILWTLVFLLAFATLSVSLDLWLSRHPVGRTLISPEERRTLLLDYGKVVAALLGLGILFQYSLIPRGVEWLSSLF